MKTLFEAIQTIFVDYLFFLHDFLRKFETTSWTISNIFNWALMGICAYYIVYWCKELKKHQINNEENQDTTAHSFLENNFLK